VKGTDKTERQEPQNTSMKTHKNSRASTREGHLSKSELERAVPTTNTPQVIRNCQQLRRAIAEGFIEFRLLLMGGAYSRKTITKASGGRFRVLNHIDGSRQVLTEAELYRQSNIGQAMTNGAFIKEGKSHD
jgi:hypothetical protein